LTPKDHQDRLQLQIALTELDTLTHRLNDTKRDSENRLEAKRLLSVIGSRPSFKVDHQDVYMVRHDDVIEVVRIFIYIITTLFYLWLTYVIGQAIYIFILWFLLLSFFFFLA